MFSDGHIMLVCKCNTTRVSANWLSQKPLFFIFLYRKQAMAQIRCSKSPLKRKQISLSSDKFCKICNGFYDSVEPKIRGRTNKNFQKQCLLPSIKFLCVSLRDVVCTVL